MPLELEKSAVTSLHARRKEQDEGKEQTRITDHVPGARDERQASEAGQASHQRVVAAAAAKARYKPSSARRPPHSRKPANLGSSSFF